MGDKENRECTLLYTNFCKKSLANIRENSWIPLAPFPFSMFFSNHSQ